MPRRYKRNCEDCGTFYKGFGKRFCSKRCGFKGKFNPYYGKQHSENTKRHWSEKRKGIKPSQKTVEARSASLKGKKRPPFSEEWKRRMSINGKGKKMPPRSEEHLRKISEALTGRPGLSGETNPRWIKDRSRLAKKQERGDPAYREWRRLVFIRDNRICRINNQDCLGKLEVHHILNWSSHPGLRYEINNGITLCHAHHPRRRAEEKKLIPYFMGLVPVLNDPL